MNMLDRSIEGQSIILLSSIYLAQNFRSFMKRNTAQHPKQIERAVKLALVELFTLKQNNCPIELAYKRIASGGSEAGPPLGPISFDVQADGRTTLTFSSKDDENALIQVLLDATNHTPGELVREGSQVQAKQDISQPRNTPEGTIDGLSFQESELCPVQQEEKTSAPSRTWRDISLVDPLMKFAVLKRASQLTGIRVPDPAIADIDNVSQLLKASKKNPKPKKIAEEIADSQGRLKGSKSLNNIKILPRRKTTRDKEGKMESYPKGPRKRRSR